MIAGLRHLGRDLALDVAAFIEAGGVGAHVLGALEAGGVLEEHVRIFVRHLQRRVHEAERGGEDELVAGAGELLDRALGVGALGDVLEEGRLDLVAERLLHRLASDVMLVAPAKVADRPDIDEADFQLIGGVSAAERSGGDREDRRHSDDVPFLHDLHSGLERRAFFISVHFSVPLRAKRPNAPAGHSPIRHEHHTQRRRRGGPGSATRPGNQHENDDRGKIGQRRHQLRRNAEPERLGVQLQDADGAEQIGAGDQPSRPPGGENHQRQRDPAAAGGHARE